MRDWWKTGFARPSTRDLRTLVSELRWQPMSNFLGDLVAQIPLLALPVPGRGDPAEAHHGNAHPPPFLPTQKGFSTA